MAVLFRGAPAVPCTLGPWPGPCVARLASRAALICSGVLRSGSESLTCSFARETWRLCRFNNLLSMDTSRSVRYPHCLNRLVASPGSSHVFAGRPAWRFSPRCSRLFCGSAILGVQAHIVFAEGQVCVSPPFSLRSRRFRHNNGSSCIGMPYLRTQRKIGPDHHFRPHPVRAHTFECEYPKCHVLRESGKHELHALRSF